jgi:hypothetical protein
MGIRAKPRDRAADEALTRTRRQFNFMSPDHQQNPADLRQRGQQDQPRHHGGVERPAPVGDSFLSLPTYLANAILNIPPDHRPGQRRRPLESLPEPGDNTPMAGNSHPATLPEPSDRAKNHPLMVMPTAPRPNAAIPKRIEEKNQRDASRRGT